MGHKENLAYELLKSGRVITSYRELKSIATRMGYCLEPSPEGSKVRDDDGKFVTMIPRRPAKYTAKGILDALKSGRSNRRILPED